MSYTDDELKAMFTKTAPGVVDAVGSVDPAMARPQSAQTVVPPPSAQVQQPAQPTEAPIGKMGLISGAIDLGKEYLAETGIGLSRGAAEGTIITRPKVKVLALKALEAMGWDSGGELEDLQSKLAARDKAFKRSETAMGTPIAGEIGKVIGEVGAGSVAGGVAGTGVTALTKGAGTLLPQVLGQMTTAGIQGAIADEQGSLLDSLKTGGKQAAIAGVLPAGQAIYNKVIPARAPGLGNAEGLSRNAAKGKRLFPSDKVQALKEAEYFKREMSEQNTLRDKFQKSVGNAIDQVEKTKADKYTQAYKQLDEVGTYDPKEVLEIPAVKALLEPRNSTPAMQKLHSMLVSFLEEGATTKPVNKLDALRSAAAQSGAMNQLDPAMAQALNAKPAVEKILRPVKPSELQFFMTDIAKELKKTKDRGVTKALKGIEGAMINFGKQFVDPKTGKNLGEPLIDAGDYFKKVALPVRKELKNISNLMEAGDVDGAVDIINNSAKAGKILKQVQQHIGQDAYEALGDLALAREFNNKITGYTLKYGDEINVPALKTALSQFRKTEIYQKASATSRAKVDAFANFTTTAAAAPAAKPTSLPAPLAPLSFAKGWMASLPSLFSKLLDNNAGRVFLTRAGSSKATKLSSQRAYMELGKMLSAAMQVDQNGARVELEGDEDKDPVHRYKDEDLREMFKGKK